LIYGSVFHNADYVWSTFPNPGVKLRTAFFNTLLRWSYCFRVRSFSYPQGGVVIQYFTRVKFLSPGPPKLSLSCVRNADYVTRTTLNMTNNKYFIARKLLEIYLWFCFFTFMFIGTFLVDSNHKIKLLFVGIPNWEVPILGLFFHRKWPNLRAHSCKVSSR